MRMNGALSPIISPYSAFSIIGILILCWIGLIVWHRRFLQQAYSGAGTRVPPEIPLRRIFLGWIVLLIGWGLLPLLIPDSFLRTHALQAILFFTGLIGLIASLPGIKDFILLLRSHIVCLTLHHFPLPQAPELQGEVEFTSPLGSGDVVLELTIYESIILNIQGKKIECHNKKICSENTLLKKSLKTLENRTAYPFSFSMKPDIPFPGVYEKKASPEEIQKCVENEKDKTKKLFPSNENSFLEREIFWEFVLICHEKPWIRFSLISLEH